MKTDTTTTRPSPFSRKAILNTDLSRELDQLGRFMAMVVEHKNRIGFEGAILIEPKPHEPTKHQYDRDTATVYGFLKRYGLEQEIKVNIEATTPRLPVMRSSMRSRRPTLSASSDRST